jgi:hypothetical protein
MTESVPVITATIALALVRAATQLHGGQQATPEQVGQSADRSSEPERSAAP